MYNSAWRFKGRWRVVRETNAIHFDENGETLVGPRWGVYSPHGVGFNNYATHAEAMARADREARTVTLTLPRTTHWLTDRHTLMLDDAVLIQMFGHHRVKDVDRATFVEIEPEELKPLAMGLLMVHYRKEMEKSNDS